MAENYILLETIELTQSAASVTFDNIPQSGYTDLKIVYSARSNDNSSGWNLTRVQFNTDTTAGNYNYRVLGGFGTTAYSGYGTQAVGYTTAGGRTANTFGNGEIYIPNYLGSTQKSYSGDSVTEGNGSTYEILGLHTALWSGTAAINQITLSLDNSASFVQYSTFSLYGVADVNTTPVTAPLATGGNIVANDGTYWYHAFLTSGTFTPQTPLSCDVLVVAGGGGGGGNTGAGGGAGGLLGFASQSLTPNNYSITVGAGGTGASNTTGDGTRGNNGNDSQFGSLTLVKGGGGGGSYSGTTSNGYGANGGSGGGGGTSESATNVGGSPTSGQGYAGGSGFDNDSGNYASGGGGGAGAVGANASSRVGGVGGNGSSVYSSWGSATSTGQNVSGTYWYAGGGGGANYGTTQRLGGNGGGGAGAYGSSSGSGADVVGTAGTANTGGGGGGGQGSLSNNAPAGGSGIVIVRYSMV